MLKHPITDIFFDLDHTLWDFDRNSALTYQNIFADLGIGVELSDFLHVYIPRNLQYWKLYRDGQIGKEDLRYQRLRSVFDQLGYPIADEQIYLLSEAYIEGLSTHTHLMPYALEILDYLHRGYRMHIITNGFEEVQFRKLRNCGIEHYFAQVIHSERAGVQKPNPRIFELALREAGVEAHKAVMIGDSLEADILGARAVGLQALHYNVHDDPSHDYCPIIRHLGEIKNHL